MSRLRLTRGEQHILKCLINGYRNKEIAAERNTTEQVIKNQLRAMYDKTGMGSRLELAMAAMVHPEWLEGEQNADTPNVSRIAAERAARLAAEAKENAKSLAIVRRAIGRVG